MAKQSTDKSSRKFDPMSIPALSNEARDAVNAAFEAMSTWRTETVNTSEKNLEQIIEEDGCGWASTGLAGANC
jgi:hypothetical protein